MSRPRSQIAMRAGLRSAEVLEWATDYAKRNSEQISSKQ